MRQILQLQRFLQPTGKRKTEAVSHAWSQYAKVRLWQAAVKPAGNASASGPSEAAMSCFVASLFAAGGVSLYVSHRQRLSPTAAQGPSVWPALASGPWNVHLAQQESKGVWAPSKAWEFQNKDSFYNNRAQGHLRANVGQRRGKQVKGQGYDAFHDPVVRDGVEMFPVHVAADDGHVWWLEICGASLQCRSMLGVGDARQGTPLHHCARCGQEASCRALLRLGADPSVKNDEQQLPEEVAAAAGHGDIAAFLQEARGTDDLWDAAGQEATLRHPDGLGVLQEPPAGVTFTGLNQAGVMRHAVNMAAGCSVAPPLPMSRAMLDAQDAAERLINVARGSLQATEFDLEDLKGDCLSTVQSTGDADALWEAAGRDGADLQGFLFYEPPGVVTQDAPGHWVAVRRVPAPGAGFFRLDPVRGPFRLSDQELKLMLGRYQAWRVVQATRETRLARTAKLGAAREEALALLEARQRGELAPQAR